LPLRIPGTEALEPFPNALQDALHRPLGAADPAADLGSLLPLQAQLDDLPIAPLQPAEQVFERLREHGDLRRGRVAGQCLPLDCGGARIGLWADLAPNVAARRAEVLGPMAALAEGDDRQHAPEAVPVFQLPAPVGLALKEAAEH